MRTLSALLFLFCLSYLVLPLVTNAATSKTLSVSTYSLDGGPTVTVQPDTTYTYKLSITNNEPSNDRLVELKPRLPGSYALSNPVICPPHWDEVAQPNGGRDVGIINCIQSGLDTTSPTTTSNPLYDFTYGQTVDLTFTFTTPSTTGTTDLNLGVFYINNSGEIHGGFGRVIARITVEPATQPQTCTSWTYSTWSSCTSAGSQSRSVLTSSPSSCTGGNPVLSQACTYTQTSQSCTSSDWSCGNWGTCSKSGNQKRACSKMSDCQGGVSSPSTSRSCVYNSNTSPCTSFDYTGWTECSRTGTQVREIVSEHPDNCSDGVTPKTSQSCTYNSACNSDTWSCGEWNTCSPAGIKTRSCKKTLDCSSVETEPPITSQKCDCKVGYDWDQRKAECVLINNKDEQDDQKDTKASDNENETDASTTEATADRGFWAWIYDWLDKKLPTGYEPIKQDQPSDWEKFKAWLRSLFD